MRTYIYSPLNVYVYIYIYSKYVCVPRLFFFVKQRKIAKRKRNPGTNTFKVCVALRFMCAKSQLGTFVFVYLEDLVFRGYTPFVNVLILKIYP